MSVFKRKMKKMRQTDIVVSWFNSVGPKLYNTSAIPTSQFPPGLQEGDFLIHSYDESKRRQVWRWETGVGMTACLWVPFQVGDARQIAVGEEPRRFVLSQLGTPTWVKNHTFKRFYDRRKPPITMYVLSRSTLIIYTHNLLFRVR